MTEKFVRKEESFRQAGIDKDQSMETKQQNDDAKDQARILPKDPQGLNPDQKGPAQPSDNKTNPT